MVRIFCFYRTASPDNDTPLQTTDISKTFDLHIKWNLIWTMKLIFMF